MPNWLTAPDDTERRCRAVERGAPALKKTDQARTTSLTPRARETVKLISQRPGDNLLRMATHLGKRENTLRNHLTIVYSKLGMRGQLELHVLATEHGLAAG